MANAYGFMTGSFPGGNGLMWKGTPGRVGFGQLRPVTAHKPAQQANHIPGPALSNFSSIVVQSPEPRFLNSRNARIRSVVYVAATEEPSLSSLQSEADVGVVKEIGTHASNGSASGRLESHEGEVEWFLKLLKLLPCCVQR
jgi:hypothetical protein